MGMTLLLWLDVAGGAPLADPTCPADFKQPPTAAQAQPAADDKKIEVPPMLAWVVSMIVVSPERCFAVINDQIVHVGQVIEEAKVADIRLNRVTLSYRGQVVELEMAENQGRKPTIQVKE